MGKAENEKRFPLSLNQTNILNLERVLRGTSANNISTTVRIQGRVDFSALKRSILLVLKKDPSLRIRLVEEEGEVLQYYAPFAEEDFPVYDFSNTNREGIEHWENAATRELLPLYDSPLYRFVLFRETETAGGVFIKIHHVISDGWSQILLCNRIAHTYLEILRGKEPTLEDAPGYDLHVREEEEYLKSKAYKKDEKYWKEILEKAEEPSSLKRVNAAAVSPVGMRKSFPLPQLLNHAIESFCTERRVSPFAVIYMALAIYFKRNGGENCFTIGVPVFNRTNYLFKQSTGMFVTTLPFLNEIDDEWSLNRFNEVLTERWLELLRHQRYPFSHMLSSSKDSSRLFQIALSYQDSKIFESRDATVTFSGRWHYSGYQAEHLVIHLTNLKNRCGYTVDYDYLTQIFSEEEITSLHRGLCHILAEALHEPDRPMHCLNVLSLEQKEELLYRFNSTDRYLKERSVYRALTEDNAKNLNRAAVIQNGQRVSYGALFHQSSRFAALLAPHLKSREDAVAILLPRGADLIAAMVGTLEAGGAYLLISESTPTERIRGILKQSGAAVLITDEKGKTLSSLLEIPVVSADEMEILPFSERKSSSFDPTDEKNSDPLAYVVYTSGSTGEPKGVEITQRNLLNLAQEMKPIYGQGAVLSLCNVGFDAFMLESIVALLNGRTVVMPTESELESPERLATVMDSYAVGFFAVTPSRLSAYLQNPVFRKVMWRMESIVCGGEPFPPELLKTLKLCSHARIYNQYGPSEATVAVSMKELSSADRITVGSPMGNCRMYVLDQWKNPLPIGGVGRLYVGGACVGRGYRNRPDLTEGAFFENPFVMGERVYDTGDLAYWTPEGEMILAGRADRQVKLRGLRIELQEISSCIEAYPGVLRAHAALAELGGQKVLGAYYVSREEIAQEKILAHCATYLPQYMLPVFLMRVKELPVTSNGKIDESSLPLPREDGGECRGSSSPAVSSLLGIFREVLSREVGENSDFFLCGGNSLNALDAVARMEKKFGKRIRVADLYAFRTPLRLAALFASDLDAEQSFCGECPLEKAPLRSEYPLTPIQEGIYVQSALNPKGFAYHMPGAFRLERMPDRNRLEEAFRQLILQDPIFRTEFAYRGDRICAHVRENVPFSLEELKGDDFRQACENFLTPFSLDRAPLLRGALWTSREGDVYLLIDCHHIIGDGMSAPLVMSRLDRFYRGEKPSVPFHYYDYVYSLSKTGKEERDLRFWTEHLKNLPEALVLPSDRTCPSGSFDFKGGEVEFSLDAKQSGEVREFCAKSGTSEFVLFLSAFGLLLSDLAQREDFLLGVPVSGRNHTEAREICGPFINTLPLRLTPGKDLTVKDWLRLVEEEVVGMMDHSHVCPEEIIAALSLPRGAQNALYRVMMTQSPVDEGAFTLDGQKMEFAPIPTGAAKMDLLLELGKRDGCFVLRLSYAESLFEEETVRFYGRCLIRTVQSLARGTEEKLRNLPRIAREDQQKYLEEPNDLTTPFLNRPIHGILKRRAADHPGETAIVSNGRSVSFEALERRACAIAHFLEKNGVKSGDCVGLLLKREPDMIAAMYGVLKAGGSYTFLLPSFPAARARYMLEVSRAVLLLYDQVPEDLLREGISCNACPLPSGEADFYEDRSLPPNGLVNVLFTSGSTGNPKGVMLRHRSVSNLYSQMKTLLDPVEGSVLCSTNAVFDCFIVETLIALALGRTVVLANEEEMMLPWKLAQLMERYHTGIFEMTPSRLQMCLTNEAFCRAAKEIRIVLLGGEVVTSALRDSFYRHSDGVLMNMYGPTEATVFTTMGPIPKTGHITIGKPLQNTRVYLLDEERKPVLPTAVGEAYLAGECLAAGYVSSEKMTRDFFLEDPFFPGEKMYRSGDLLRLRADGEYDYVGRKDDQVKVNGQRVELSEIKGAIDQSGQALSSAVIALRKEDGATELFAFYVPKDKDSAESDLKQFLSRILPPYMIPSRFVKMDTLPTTATAKTDRLALKKTAEELLLSRFVSKKDVSRGEEEKKETRSLAESEEPSLKNGVCSVAEAPKETISAPDRSYFRKIWAQVLQNDHISDQISFFAQGGSSMAALNVLNAYYGDGYEMSLSEFYEKATVEEQYALFRSRFSGESSEEETVGSREHASKGDEPRQTGVSAPEEIAESASSCRKGILVTGATGFLGIHVVKKLLESGNETVYCLLHSGGMERFCDFYRWYFREVPADLSSRVRVIEGDITCERLHLSEEQYEELASSIGEIYHCAADVRHYTAAEEVILKANLTGTEHVLALARLAGAVLYHMSTSSVSGENTAGGKKTVFTEDDFDIGKTRGENIYVKSKFLAEKAVFAAMKEGLRAKIFRLGRLVGRASDGRFQRNADSNAFCLLMRGLTLLSELPEKAAKVSLDLMPIDLCVEEIFALKKTEGTVFHIIHPNPPTLLCVLQSLGKEMQVVDNDVFSRILKEKSRSLDRQLMALVANHWILLKTKPEAVTVSCEKTVQQLKRAGFEFPRISIPTVLKEFWKEGRI